MEAELELDCKSSSLITRMSDDKLAKKFSEDEGSSGDDADLDALESETEQEEIKGRNKVYEKKVSLRLSICVEIHARR